ncbi:phosphatase PAP2 family protein [Gordonia sp. DT30]|uniref:phosphatase PAP2 family protein n=1 Tax=Gordonia sp. DT30 TaxID=3416546 RepID=UPI003CEDA915
MSVLATTPRPGVTPRREVRRPTGLGVAVVTAVIALLLAAAVYGIAVRTSWGQLVDQYVLDAVRRSSPVAHVPHLLTVQAVTDPRIWVVAAMLAVAGSVVPAVTGRAPVGVAIAKTAALLAFPLVIVLLVRFLRDGVLVRPQLHSWIAETSNSAPSGHTAAVTSCVVVLIAAAPKWLRPVVVALGATWASVVAFGLIADGWHRPSDVVISVLIVVGLGALLPDPYADSPAPRGSAVLRAAAALVPVVATPLIVETSYTDPRQIVTAVAIAVAMGLALACYRPCAYRSSRTL